jgi:hypothetical protein
MCDLSRWSGDAECCREGVILSAPC